MVYLHYITSLPCISVFPTFVNDFIYQTWFSSTSSTYFVVVNAAIAVFAAVIAHNLQGLVQVWFDINKTELEMYFKNWAQEWLHD